MHLLPSHRQSIGNLAVDVALVSGTKINCSRLRSTKSRFVNQCARILCANASCIYASLFAVDNGKNLPIIHVKTHTDKTAQTHNKMADGNTHNPFVKQNRRKIARGPRSRFIVKAKSLCNKPFVYRFTE